MSFHIYFGMSAGLATPIRAPKGTLGKIHEHIAGVESSLGLKREQYAANPPHWDKGRPPFQGIPDEVLCETVGDHNNWVRWLYKQFGEWSQTPVKDGEEIKPSDAKGFWHALEMLNVEPDRWTRDYYRARMEAIYNVLRGFEYGTDGMSLDAAKLTTKQAAAVINLFSQYLDSHDMRLDVPKGRDHLASSYDGGYSWCDLCCSPIDPEDIGRCRRKKCPLREECEA